MASRQRQNRTVRFAETVTIVVYRPLSDIEQIIEGDYNDMHHGHMTNGFPSDAAASENLATQIPAPETRPTNGATPQRMSPEAANLGARTPEASTSEATTSGATATEATISGATTPRATIPRATTPGAAAPGVTTPRTTTAELMAEIARLLFPDVPGFTLVDVFIIQDVMCIVAQDHDGMVAKELLPRRLGSYSIRYHWRGPSNPP